MVIESRLWNNCCMADDKKTRKHRKPWFGQATLEDFVIPADEDQQKRTPLSPSELANHKIGRKLREYRESKRLTQADVGKRLSALTGDRYPQSTIGKIERGERALSFVEAVYLGQVYNLEAQQITDLVDDHRSMERQFEDIGKSLHALREMVDTEVVKWLLDIAKRFYSLTREYSDEDFDDPETFAPTANRAGSIISDFLMVINDLRASSEDIALIASNFDVDMVAEEILDNTYPGDR